MMMKTAVIYTRVSTAEQADLGTSLSTQEQACRQWCEARGFAVTKVFSDAGESAKTADRPQLLALISWCGKHKPAVCVVWKFDRWARNSTDHAVAAAAIAKHGSRLVSATEAAADDPAGRLLQTILAGIAQFDNEVRAERAKQAMRAVAMRGGWFTHAPLGYMYSRSGSLPILVEDSEWAPLIREMFEGLSTRRRSLSQTVTMASEQGIKPGHARKILRSPVYAGIIKSSLTNNQPIEAAFPGLVDRDVWIAAQNAIDGRNRRPYTKQRDVFPLRGILHCDVCGRMLTACFSTGKRGTRYGYYQCGDSHVRMRIEAADVAWRDMLARASAVYAPILKEIREEIRDILHERIEAAQTVERDAQAEVNRLKSRRSRLLDVYLSGAIDQHEFTTRDADLQLQIMAAADVSAKKVSWSMDVETAMGECIQMLENPVGVWDALDVAGKHKFARALYGDDIRLTVAGTFRTSASGGIAIALGDINDTKSFWRAYGESTKTQLTGFFQALVDLAECAA